MREQLHLPRSEGNHHRYSTRCCAVGEDRTEPPSDAPLPPPTSSNSQVTAFASTTEAQLANEAEAAMETSEAAEMQVDDIETDDARESANTTLLAEADDLPSSVNQPLNGVTRAVDSVQMPLL